MVRSYYKVAEHLFAVECSDGALLSCMTNYEPFREPTLNPFLNAPHDAGVIGDPAKGGEDTGYQPLKTGEYYKVTIIKSEDFDLYAQLWKQKN